MAGTDELIEQRTLVRLEYFRRRGENAPNFKARLTLPNFQPPIRAYFHNAGLAGAFPVKAGDYVELEAKGHLVETIDKLDVSKYLWILAAIWGKEGAKMIDFFGYHGIQRWPGNPCIDSFATANGVIAPRETTSLDEKEVTCEDGAIVLGVEGPYRRTTKSLAYYMNHFPAIHGLSIH